MPRLTRDDLKAGLALLDRADAVGSPSELAPVGLRLDAWLEYPDAIPLPDGGTWPEPGADLGPADSDQLWLLSRGRVLVVPGDPRARPREMALTEAPPEAQLGDRLRGLLLATYLGHSDLSATPAPMVPGVVGDLLELTRELNPAGRQTVLRALAAAMRPAPGWNEAATRLRVGFEGALGDRSPEAVTIAVRALVQMAVGLGPRPPAGEPSRELAVLLGMPRSAVREQTLQALLEVPEEALLAVGTVVEPLATRALDDDDAEVRRLASAVERRLLSLAAATPAAGLESDSAAERVAALRAWSAEAAGGPDRRLTLPLVLAAADDPDEAVSAAALEALVTVAGQEDPALVRLVAHGLLLGRAEKAIAAGATLVARDPALADHAVVAALRAAAAGHLADAGPVVAALVAVGRSLPAEEAVADIESLLWHADSGVRREVLRHLGRGAIERVQVRDPLVVTVVELLHDNDAELRLLAARAVSDLGLGHVGGVVGQLAFDPDHTVRHGALDMLLASGDERAVADAEAVVGLADSLFELAAGGRPDDRVHWAGALEKLAQMPSPHAQDTLTGLLRAIPADSQDPFHSFAVEEIVRHMVERTECGTELVEVCRHLMAPPEPRPDQAARLAAACATEQPMAFDFLWTMSTAAQGEAAAVAGRALAGLVGEQMSPPVEALIAEWMERTQSVTERAMLRLLARGERPGAK